MTAIENLSGALTEEAFPGEVVTRAIVRDVDLGAVGTLALITLDNGHDHTKPSTFGPQGLLSLNAALDAVAARAAAGEIAAVGVTGKPFILAAGADLDGAGAAITAPGIDPAVARERAAGIGALGHAVFRRLGELPVPSFCFINGVALGGGLEVALHCTYRTISSGAAHGRLPRVLPRPGPRLGRRLPAAPAHRPGRRAEAHHREPPQPEQDDRRGRGVLARHRRRDVRARRLPRGVAPLGRPGPRRLGHGRAGPAGRRGHLGRRRRRHPVPHRRQAARRRARPLPGARPGRGRPHRHPRRGVRGRGRGAGRPAPVGRAPGRAVRLRPGAEAGQAAGRGARPGPRQEGHQGRRRRRRADGRPDRAAVRPAPAGPGRDDRPGPGPGGLRRRLRARRDRQAAGARAALGRRRQPAEGADQRVGEQGRVRRRRLRDRGGVRGAVGQAAGLRRGRGGRRDRTACWRPTPPRCR